MVILADRNGVIDSAYHTLVKHINSPMPIVMVSYHDRFIFNPELLSLKKNEFVLMDFVEMGWNYDWSKHSLGNYHKRFDGDEWKKFHEWADNKPLIVFRRELDKPTSKIPGYYPIEYPCNVWDWEIDTEKKFNNRPLSCFQYWGRSNENRLRIHGDIWHHATKKGFSVCDNVYYIEKFIREEKGEKWVTLNIPHWARIDINQLMPFNAMSKLSLSWPGSGFKCFRNCEAPANSVMVMHKNNFAWSFDWDETNCILVEPGKEMEGIDEALRNPNLYEIYKAGVENCNKYRLKHYIPYLEKIINDSL